MNDHSRLSFKHEFQFVITKNTKLFETEIMLLEFSSMDASKFVSNKNLCKIYMDQQ